MYSLKDSFIFILKVRNTFGLESPFIISEMMSMGTGKTMVLLFSWEMLFRV